MFSWHVLCRYIPAPGTINKPLSFCSHLSKGQSPAYNKLVAKLNQNSYINPLGSRIQTFYQHLFKISLFFKFYDLLDIH